MNKDIVRLSFIMATLFEKILRGEVPSHRVASGDGWYAFLDIFPRREGHTLVIPTRGVQRLAALNPQEQGALMEGVTRVQTILGTHFQTEDFTICVHDGPLAGQEVPHVHVHVIPRTSGDGGGTLMSMWPIEASTSDHEGLATLSVKLQDVN